MIAMLLALVALTAFGQSNTIADTYWRNEQTGDWQIGFAEKHVIYNNKVWEIVCQTEKKDAYTLTADNGETIKVGKAKNGRRTIAIGKGKPVVCSQITTEHMPDYPTEDLAPFKDNDYRMGDTATIVGWLKDCPKEMLNQNREFDIEATSLFSRKDFNANGKIDSLGRFVVKMPVENTQEAYMDWGCTTLCTVLEPGETYFFLHDCKTGQQLFMGSNARVQNELLAHDIRQESAQLDRQGMTEQGIIDYKDRWAATYERNNAKLDSVIMYHPTLSRRYEDHQRMDMLCKMASDVMQAMCFIKGWKLPVAVTSYVESQVWQSNRLKKPYTMVRNFSWVLYYYHMNANHTNPRMQRQVLTPSTLQQMGQDGIFNFSQEDHELIDLWD